KTMDLHIPRGHIVCSRKKNYYRANATVAKKNAVQGLPSSRTLVLAPCHRCKPSGSTIRQHIHAQTHTYILKYIFSAPPLLHRYHHIATAENADLYHTDKIPYSSYNLLFNK
ncbi:hypothetical protein COCCADRAFT_90660, partial [Bipolaris zeicola 26-R-13]